MKKTNIILLIGGLVALGSTTAHVLQYMNLRSSNKTISYLVKMKEESNDQIISEQNTIAGLHNEISRLRRALETFVGEDAINFIVDSINDKQSFKQTMEKQCKMQELVFSEEDFPCFDSISHLDGMTIQRILRDVDSKDLVIALKGSNQEICDSIFQNMSQRMGETVRSDVEYLHNISKKEIRMAKLRITGLIRELRDSGEIVCEYDWKNS